MDVNIVFSNYLKKNDLKSTPERLTILQQALTMQMHFDADNLLFQLKTKNYKISRATVYRTLELLVNCGLLKKIIFGKSGALYEQNIDSKGHDHFKCLKCEKIIEFIDNDLEKIHERFSNEHGIEIVDYSHQIFGICSDCRQMEVRSV